VLERPGFVVADVVLPGRGEVLMVHAGPAAPAGPYRRRWQREVQILVDEHGRAQVWVDGVEVVAPRPGPAG
jgi:hypothetical protein